jgi:hypothetical protein
MKNVFSSSRQFVVLLLFVVVLFLISRFLRNYNTQETFCHFKATDVIRNSTLVIYSYTVNSKKYEGNFYKSHITDEKFKLFKNGDSLKIKYSKLLPFYSFIDESEIIK